MKASYVIVVDGYSSGLLYFAAVKSLGIKAIHVKSFPCSLPFLSGLHQSSNYEADLECYDFNYEEIIRKVKAITRNKPIGAVLVGTTAYNGFMLADYLAKAFNIPGNDPLTTMQRIDKYLMNQTLAEKSVPALKQHLTSDYNEMSKWANHIGYPVLLKPLLSGGADGIYICNDEQQLKKAFFIHANIKDNLYGSNNPPDRIGKVLAQELLQGTEYVVCTFSNKSEHCVTSIWKSEKRLIDNGRTKARDYLELLVPDDDFTFRQLCSYIKNVLTALGIENGPCNSDIIIDPKRGPLLLEVNPRVPGGMDPIIFFQAQNDSNIHQTVDWSFHPENILSSDNYPFKCYAFCVSLVVYRDGIIKELDISAIENLPSFLKAVLKYKIGDSIKKTMDITNLAGMIYLVNTSKEQILQDLYAIRNWEKVYLDEKLYSTPNSTSLASNQMFFVKQPTTIDVEKAQTENNNNNSKEVVVQNYDEQTKIVRSVVSKGPPQ